MTKAGGRYLFTTFPLTLSTFEVSPLVKLTLNDCITDTAGDCDDDPAKLPVRTFDVPIFIGTSVIITSADTLVIIPYNVVRCVTV